MKMLLTLVACCLLSTNARALPSDPLQDALNHEYKGRIYTLRQPFIRDTQQYDSLGHTLMTSTLGPWTVYGRIELRKIRVQSNRLVVEGRRIGMEFSDRSRTLVPSKLDDKVKLEISLVQPLNSVDQARDVFSHIFAFTKDDFLAALPVLWRQYLNDNLESYTDDGRQLVFKPYKPPRPADNQKPQPPANDVYYVGKDVTAPRARLTPDPDYSVAARAAKFQATLVVDVIVDKAGEVRSISLTKPGGMGLDEETVRTVQRWRFEPARRNGEPVAVEVSVEVTFQLY